MPTRKMIVDCARTFLNTPFRHQGRVKGKGIDCVGLPLCVAEELGLIDRLGVPFKGSDNQNYSSQPLDLLVHEEAKRRLVEKDPSDLRDGDVVTLRVPTTPCHAALITTVNGVTGMIHAYAGIGKVVEHIMDNKWRKRIAGAFSYPGVED